MRSPKKYIELEYSYDFSSRLITVDRTDGYLGHPDLVSTDDGKLFVAYPMGHGRGSIIMKRSDDMGLTWSERLENLPSSWEKSQETPTLYKLEFKDGRSKLVLISGAPKWSGMVLDGKKLPYLPPNGFNFSYSDDDGRTWTEFENFYSPMDCIVAMSSLTRIKENGEFADKWMGTFHDRNFVNYKTFLTFDKSGAHWSKPEPLLWRHRKIEKTIKICEVEILRSLDDKLFLIARAQARKTRSVISVSYDEGNSWTEPVELPYVLSGDRHKAEYDKESGKVIISFRQYLPVGKRPFSIKKGISDGWVCWIGTFDDLLSMATAPYKETYGEKLYLLGYDYGAGDCGYSGLVVNDGKAVLTSYGRFDEKAENPYIVSLILSIK